MRTALIISLSVLYMQASAQQLVKKNIEVGMYIRINKCKGTSFESMDLYTKTRFPKTTVEIDTITGDGVYENFFTPGDFDAKRLPASYGNKKYKIAALRIFDEKDGAQRQVMICYTNNKYSMIWIEVSKAVALKEIDL